MESLMTSAAVSRPWDFNETTQWERDSFMAIVNALAGIMVSELTTAEAWYELLLSRPADARPMEGLAEWKLADGGWIQVFQDKERAGSSSVTLLVSGLDDQLAELKAKGISIETYHDIRLREDRHGN